MRINTHTNGKKNTILSNCQKISSWQIYDTNKIIDEEINETINEIINEKINKQIIIKSLEYFVSFVQYPVIPNLFSIINYSLSFNIKIFSFIPF